MITKALLSDKHPLNDSREKQKNVIYHVSRPRTILETRQDPRISDYRMYILSVASAEGTHSTLCYYVGVVSCIIPPADNRIMNLAYLAILMR